MNDFVRTIDLSKRYGQRTVVDRLNLRVPQGSVYGFLGPNGAGKSTTMKMLLSLVEPSSGQVLIGGQPMNRSTRRRHLAHIGSLIESPPGYGHLTGAENMRIVQRLLDLPNHYVKDAVDTVRLGGQMDKRVREYSLGMKQRLGIAMALARRPSLLILDEPTNGLDPAGIEEIRRLLRSLASDGVTVIVSSHLLGEIDRIATVLGIVSRGGLLFQGTRTELMSASAPDTLLGCSHPLAAAHLLFTRGAASTYEHGLLRVPGLSQQATADVVALLVREGIGVHEVRQEEQTLEDVFMALTRGGGL
ncbi:MULTISPECIES: ABC transporter ATP-binding protein [Actinomyces]|uniref:ABC transporter ATP-binding protein n=1 Tax=Actinomyces oris TaxID=544580 RepID=A0A1Q8VNP0_9ACTO|nr:ABC transporter ATP-binding protein [Actinomyces oris]OLO49699.1 ABC transporter ATP-binding protein [Actinomyces oris]